MTRGRALLLCVAGGLLGAVGVGRVWVVATYDRLADLGSVTVSHTGRDVQPLAGALVLVALAGVGGLLATRGRARAAVGVLVAGTGVALAGTAARTMLAPAATLPDGAVGDRVGLAPEAVAVTATLWPWLAVAAGLLLVAGGGAAALLGRRWQAMGSRYDGGAPAATAPADAAAPDGIEVGEVGEVGDGFDGGDGLDAVDLWASLDAGQDPTQAPRGGAAGSGR